ncbi:MAG: DUF4399 domain-containing protein [Longimicrobiales bacterium]
MTRTINEGNFMNRPARKHRQLLLCLLPLAVFAEYGCTGETGQQAGAPVDSAAAKAAALPTATITLPPDGSEVQGTSVLLVLSVQNLLLAPAGDTTPGSGHHHLFINTPVVAPGEAIPAGVPGIVHLGQAQTSYELTNLTPGEYTVIPVLGDLAHRRIEPQLLDTLRFRVR